MAGPKERGLGSGGCNSVVRGAVSSSGSKLCVMVLNLSNQRLYSLYLEIL